MDYFIGIDTSTTATKVLLMDETGGVVSVSSSEYSFEAPQPLWSEQNPDLWWQATIKCVHQIMADAGIEGSQIIGIGLTEMHGLVLLNKRGQVLRPTILWNDQRTGSQCDQIRDRTGKKT